MNKANAQFPNMSKSVNLKKINVKTVERKKNNLPKICEVDINFKIRRTLE